MKAVGINQYGGINEYHDLDLTVPKINDNQVLINIKAASVNPIDWKVRRGDFQKILPLKFPAVLGYDVAGVITQTGKNVTNFQVGDRVLTTPKISNRGTYAEYTAVDANILAILPRNINYEIGAGIPLAGMTAWQGIFDYLHVTPGQKVLMQGGAGGVGTFGIQILKLLGAIVYTTASPKNAALLKKLGADKVIDYHTTDFSKVLHDLDAVFDTIGGEVLQKSYDVLKPNGRLVTTVGPIDEQLAKSKDVIALHEQLDSKHMDLQPLVDLVSDKKIKVIIDSIHEFSAKGVKEASAISESHHANGKVIISMLKK